MKSNMNNKNDAPIIAKAYNSWLDECIEIKSHNTIRSYEYTMKLYINFLEETKGMKSGLFFKYAS